MPRIMAADVRVGGAARRYWHEARPRRARLPVGGAPRRPGSCWGLVQVRLGLDQEPELECSERHVSRSGCQRASLLEGRRESATGTTRLAAPKVKTSGTGRITYLKGDLLKAHSELTSDARETAPQRRVPRGRRLALRPIKLSPLADATVPPAAVEAANLESSTAISLRGRIRVLLPVCLETAIRGPGCTASGNDRPEEEPTARWSRLVPPSAATS